MILFLLFFYFFLMLFLNFFAAGWIMELIYREAGITKREADQYRREHITGGRMQDQNRRALYWLESRSKNPARVRGSPIFIISPFCRLFCLFRRRLYALRRPLSPLMYTISC